MLCFPFTIATATGGVKIFADQKLWDSLQNVWGIYPQVGGPRWKVLKHSSRLWRPWHRPVGHSLRIPDCLGSEPGRTCPFLNRRWSFTAALTRGTLREGKRHPPCRCGNRQRVGGTLEQPQPGRLRARLWERLAASLQNTKSKITCKSKCTKNPVFEMFIQVLFN